MQNNGLKLRRMSDICVSTASQRRAMRLTGFTRIHCAVLNRVSLGMIFLAC